MGRRRRRQDDDFDDSLERAFHAKRSKPETDSSKAPEKSASEKDSETKANPKSADEIERLREKKRLKKQRQKEKKLAAKQEQEKQEALREKERQKREKQKQDRKKLKELEKKRSASTEAFVKTAMGVRYMDIVVGKGPEIVDRKKVVCNYVLRAKNKTGKLIDSGDRFAFRYGRGEVIKGWEIGLKGMKQGGKRHIIVPPQAGYGNKDIGGGKGAILYFDVTLLQC